MTLPEPRTAYGVGHLSRWSRDPLALIEEGARLGPVFGLRLWRPAVLGCSPDWNRFVLGAGWHLIVYTLPWVLAPRRRGWLVPLALGLAERALVEIKTERGAVWQALLIPLSPLAAAPIVARALRRNQRWRGRVYP